MDMNFGPCFWGGRRHGGMLRTHCLQKEYCMCSIIDLSPNSIICSQLYSSINLYLYDMIYLHSHGRISL